MRRWTPDSKIPKDHVICPECDQRYSFIDCRVTSKGVNRCLSCHIKFKLSPDKAIRAENTLQDDVV